MKSVSGRASEAAIIHRSNLSELRCAACTGAPNSERSLRQTAFENKALRQYGTCGSLSFVESRSVPLVREDVTPLAAR